MMKGITIEGHAATAVGDQLLRVGEVASILGLSTRKVWSLASTDELPALRIGTARRWRASVVRAYLDTLSAAVDQ